MEEVAQPATIDDGQQPAVDQMPSAPSDGEDELVIEDLLVEEVSIDGMCGVY